MKTRLPLIDSSPRSVHALQFPQTVGGNNFAPVSFPPSPANNIDRVGRHAYPFLVQFSGRLDHTNITYGGKGEVMLNCCEIVSINRSKNHSRRRIKEGARVSIKHAEKQQVLVQSALTEVIDCQLERSGVILKWTQRDSRAPKAACK